MSQYQSLEDYAAHVRSVSSRQLAALCHTFGPMHPTSLAIAALCTEAAGIVQQAKMQAEVAEPERYDLAALHVEAHVASNSETPFEED